MWEAARMLKLAALGLVAAARIMQLVDARDGSSRPASDVIEASDVAAVAAISRSLEGGTARQRNPHPQGSLAFLSWVTARLGGWTGYYRPPGPKTMATGLLRLNERLEGYRLAMATKMCESGTQRAGKSADVSGCDTLRAWKMPNHQSILPFPHSRRDGGRSPLLRCLQIETGSRR